MQALRAPQDVEILVTIAAAQMSSTFPNDSWKGLVDRAETLVREVYSRDYAADREPVEDSSAE